MQTQECAAGLCCGHKCILARGIVDHCDGYKARCFKPHGVFSKGAPESFGAMSLLIFVVKTSQ